MTKITLLLGLGVLRHAVAIVCDPVVLLQSTVELNENLKVIEQLPVLTSQHID